jgi:glycosyltransferase 2 family protein
VIASSSPSPSPGFLRRHGAKLVASLIITIGMLYTLEKSGLELWPEASAFRSVRWWTIPLYVTTLVVMSYFRAVRWRYLLRSFADISTRRILAVSWIGFAAILLMPFRIGEIVRPYMIREKGKVSVTSATGTVVGERVTDGLYLSVVLALALVFVPFRNAPDMAIPGLPHVTVGDVRHAGFAMLGIFVTAFATISVFYFARAWAERITFAVVGLVSRKLAEKLAATASKLADGLHFLRRGRDAVPFLLETTLYWGLNAFGMWLLAWGCGVTHADGTILSFGEACAIMGTLGVTILIPGPPGLLGVFHAGVIMGLGMYVGQDAIAKGGPGTAYAALMFAVQFVWTILAGGMFLVGNRGALRALEEAEGIVPSSGDASAADAPAIGP